MANPRHVTKLQEGVDSWNTWRKQNPNIQPDLSGTSFARANLVGADLAEANLAGTDLVKANLTRADLAHTYLVGADLAEANLARADLIGADLIRANLTWVVLTRADLTGANLVGANLVGAELVRTNFDEASLDEANFASVYLYETIFADVNLTAVKSLDSCRHGGPSIIDHRTLERSGKLPLSFLRGCGLPDTFIDYLPSLLNQPIQFYSCFISYSSKDEALAQRLHADLQDRGIRCWFAPEDMKIGDRFRVRIDEAIRMYEKLLLLLSEHSVASTWVEKEVETAFEKEREHDGEPVLFPIRLDAAVMKNKTGWAADIRRSRHIGDFCNWKNHDKYQKGLEKLLHDLEIEKGE